MSKFIAAAATSHTLSVAAMEEASRLGQHEVDIDHLLLALVINEQVAGQALRSLGLTLEGAREAIAAQHAEQLASLGVTAEPPAPGRIRFHESGTYDWGPRALEIMRRGTEGKKRGDAAAVLRELVTESSGFIEEVLHRLGTTPGAVLARLDEAERSSVKTPPAAEPEPLSGTSESFVPAPVEQVWALLADPARMPEWEPGTGSVEDTPDQIGVGATWLAHAPQQRPDGKPVGVKPAFQTAMVEVTGLEDHRYLEWRFAWMDAPKANTRRIRIELAPAPGGTQLRLRSAWELTSAPARRPVRRVMGWVMRPLYRYALWMQCGQLTGAISRAFR
ncbi:MAG: SRPBCC family protein [Propioniciclava sp.]|uniref:SRPBCC family protein n=1 Tax=Propioniciclava sp. TaxID=2038686 RepID=UPI0039E2E8D7